MKMRSQIFVFVFLASFIGCNSDEEYVFNPVSLAGYLPKKVITDFSSIDLDLKSMHEAFESNPGNESFAVAKRIYEEGAHSKSYAKLHLDGGLRETLYQGEYFMGINQNGDQIYATAKKRQEKGHTVIELEYFVDDQITFENRCHVGACPNPVTTGCFPATGNVTIADDMHVMPYWYDPLTENLNERTFQHLSSKADTKMKPCNACDFFPDFQKMYEYYGVTDFADRFILGAFDGTRVQLEHGRPMDFTKFAHEGRARAIERLIVTMSVNQHILREMESAIHYCDSNDLDSAVKAVDVAAAFYVGHLEGEDGKGDGHMLYELADQMYKDFKTCGSKGTSTHGVSKVNIDIIQNLGDMIHPIETWNCAKAHNFHGPVARQMRVPLVQGLLKAMYRKTQGKATEQDEADALVFKASLTPIIAHCHLDDADKIEGAVGGYGHQTDFAAFKELLEKQYSCLGITGADVGGYYDAQHYRYYEGAEPYSEEGEDETNDHALLLKLLWFVLLPLGLCWFCCCRPRKKSKEDEYLDDLSQDSDDDDLLT